MTPNVQFETESELEQSFPMSGARKKAGMTQWVINHSGGLIRNEKQANYILILVTILFFAISIIILSNVFRGPSKPPAGFEGNVPNTPEYQDYYQPQNLQ